MSLAEQAIEIQRSWRLRTPTAPEFIRPRCASAGG